MNKQELYEKVELSERKYRGLESTNLTLARQNIKLRELVKLQAKFISGRMD